MSEATKNLGPVQCEQYAGELRGILPKNAPKNAGPVGDTLWGHLQSLLTAIESGNVWAIWAEIQKAIDHFRNPEHGREAMGAVGIDWGRLSAFLQKLVSFILPLLF